MNLLESFAAVVRALQSREIPFAVAGGFAASLYRDQPRLTQDVALGIHLAGNRLQVAQDILQNLGLKTGVARAADLAGGPLFVIQSKVRPKDLDDLDSIFKTKPAVEWTYLQSEIKRMKLKLPSTAKPFLPDVLCRLLRT